MAFNRALDKELFSAEIGDNGLKVGIFSYNGGDKKFQIGPRTYTKKDGTTGFNKVGRMSMNEVVDLAVVLGSPDFTKVMGGE